MTPERNGIDAWHDDDGVWFELDRQTYGPFESEAAMERAWVERNNAARLEGAA